ncbi:MAG TPA: hypothetical protein VFE10_07545 [Phenylobacterium sp.]|jgi:hypothetical protein|nr:hypothetical protein [Phenylobacterium sp.]
MHDAAIYHRLSDDLVKRASVTADDAERARLVAIAAAALARAVEVAAVMKLPTATMRGPD